MQPRKINSRLPLTDFLSLLCHAVRKGRQYASLHGGRDFGKPQQFDFLEEHATKNNSVHSEGLDRRFGDQVNHLFRFESIRILG